MNIAMVSIWFHRGQTEVTKTFKKVFEELGHEVFIHARMGGIGNQPKLEFNRYGWEDKKICYYNTYDLLERFSDGSIGSEMLDKIEEQKIDLVFFNEEYDWTLVELIKSQGFKVATYLDYLHKDWLVKPSPLGIYDLVVCSTKRAYEMVKDYCNARWIGWGIDLERIKIEYPWEKRPYVFFENVGWAGINDRKGIGFLLQVYKEFLNKNEGAFGSLLLHTQLDLISNKTEEEKKQAKQWFNGVDLISGSMNLPGLYHMAQVYCYPAKLDGLGLSLLEAMANGLAIICPDAPPWNEFVSTGVNGWLVPVIGSLSREREDGIAFKEVYVDKEAFLQAMEFLYKNVDVRKKYGRDSLEIVETLLSWNGFRIEVGACLDRIGK